MNAALQLNWQPGDYRCGLVIDGRYRLVRLLDEGGMSWVWLGHHVALDIPVTVKIIKPLAEKAVELGALEGRMTAALRHASIVTVLDSGCTEWGDPFVVMEYLDGESLAQVLSRDRRMCARSIVQLMLPALDALSHCHRRGIRHGDIKPANVFLARENGRTHVKLLDFGVARAIAGYEPTPELTGTPGYMAPEQVLQAHVDHRADIWSVSAVLYEAVAGRPTIAGRTCGALLTATIACEVEPLADRGNGEARLWTILERGLRAAPLERFATIGALSHALTTWLGEHAEPRAPASFASDDAQPASEGPVSGVGLQIEQRPEQRTGERREPPVRNDWALGDTIAAGARAARKRRHVQWHWEPRSTPRPRRARAGARDRDAAFASAPSARALLFALPLALAALTVPTPVHSHVALLWRALSGVQQAFAAEPARTPHRVAAGLHVQPVASADPPPAALPDCIAVRADARYRNYGYDHVVIIDNRCSVAAVCDVATDVNSTSIRVLALPGRTVEVITFRGSPVRSFVPEARCRLVGS